MRVASIVYNNAIERSYMLLLIEMDMMGGAVLCKLQLATILSNSGNLKWILQVYLHNIGLFKNGIPHFIRTHYCAVIWIDFDIEVIVVEICLLYTSPSPRDS